VRLVSWLLCSLLPACGHDGSLGAVVAAAAQSATAPGAAAGEALAAVQQGRCLRCHEASGGEALALSPLPAVPLLQAPAFRAGPALAEFLRRHHGGGDSEALAAFVRAVAPAAALADAAIAPGAVDRGAEAWRHLACTACHGDGIDGLAARTDHAHVAAFLTAPAARRPDLAHDFALDQDEASALAAFLLRAQLRDDGAATAARQGLAFECFELQIKTKALPDLTGRTPARSGTTPTVDIGVRTRDDHFALRFTGQLLVPRSGEWTFTCGSDDCSWLWIDDRMVVRNEALAPHRRKSGTVQLDAGAHALRVVYTEAAGDQSLEVLWAGPDQPEAPLPAAALATRAVAFAAPAAGGGDASAAVVGAGRAAYAQHRCGACHDLPDAPAPLSASKRWALLGGDGSGGQCPECKDGAALAQRARSAVQVPLPPAVELAAALERNGCLHCHSRDGRGGMAPAARAQLAEVEDLGDEGRSPPDLTRVGHRLRTAWLERALRGDVHARPYVRARMPHLPPDLAARFVRLFVALDGQPGDDDEPPFSSAAVERGRALAGSTGRNCVTCHSFAERRAMGPQGMDLAVQHQRLRPAWFRDWLLHPTTLRPGTRMPAAWFRGDEQDRADADALRVWSSLGRDAPVPAGLRRDGDALVLDPVDRPILHGAFLRGLSPRCLCVGSPLRGHYAYDVEHARLAWLWRGAFVDAAGTWTGRAGQLLSPLGGDQVVLDDLPFVDVEAAGAHAAERRCTGQLRTDDGYPVFLLRVGGATLEDEPRPQLRADGVELVRTLRCTHGRVRVPLQPQSGRAQLFVGDAPAVPCELREGESVAVVYRW